MTNLWPYLVSLLCRMTPRAAMLVFGSVCVLPMGSLRAAAPAESLGGLSGRIEDADFNEGLPNARVTVEGTEFVAATDRDGRFFINGVPPGGYTLIVQRDGYAQNQAKVSVGPGRVTDADLALLANVEEMEGIVLTLEDDAADTAVLGPASLGELKLKELDSIAQSFGAKFLSEVGGRDVGGALKKLAGISTTGGGKYVVIRGLADRYNVVYLNNARIPSSDPDRRAVNVDIFPTKLIDNVISSKTFTPDMPGEATGGMINLFTRAIPEKDFVDVSLSYGYNSIATGNANWLTYRGGGTGWFGTKDERKLPQELYRLDLDASLTPAERDTLAHTAERKLSRVMSTERHEAPVDHNHSIILGKRFMLGDSPAGIVAGFTHAKRYQYQDNMFQQRGAIPNEFGFDVKRRQIVDRGVESLLTGGMISLGVEPSPDHKLELTFFGNLAADDRALVAEGFDGSFGYGVGEFEQGFYVTEQESLYYTERKLASLQLRGEHKYPNWDDAQIDWILSASQSSQDEPDIRFLGATYFPAGIAGANPLYTEGSGFSGDFAPISRSWRTLTDYNYNFGINFKVPFAEGSEGEEAYFKFGGAFDYSTRELFIEPFNYTPLGGGYENAGNARLAQAYLDPTYRDVIFGPGSAQVPVRDNARIDLDGTQVITAGYAMAKFDIVPDLEVLMGARVETTLLEMHRNSRFGGIFTPDGFFLVDPQGVKRPHPADVSIDQSDFLPVGNVSWEFAKDMKARVHASKTIARPSFKEIGPAWYFEPDGRELFYGNPDLVMSDVTNIDARVEYTPKPGEVIAVTAFTKFLRNPIEYVQNNGRNYFDNQTSGQVYGFELEFQRKLDFITDSFKDFSLGSNYAYIYSSVELDKDVVDQRRQYNPNVSSTRRLQGQPDYLLNFNVSYDNADSGVFMGVFLNVVGTNLIKPGADAFTPDVYEEPISTLDMTVSKKFKNDWKFTFRASNLLRSEVTRFYDGPGRPIYDQYKTPVTYSLGLSKNW